MSLEDFIGPSPAPVAPSWERWATEDDRAWDAFKQFRDATPPRKQARVIGHGTSTKCRWYNQFRWVERCAAYDRHMEQIRQEEREALLRQNEKEVFAEHMAALQSARHVVMREMDKLLQTVNDSDGQILRPAEMSKLLEMVIKYDRLVRGETTEEVGHNTDLSGLSLDDLKKLKELREKMDNKDGTDTRH